MTEHLNREMRYNKAMIKNIKNLSTKPAVFKAHMVKGDSVLGSKFSNGAHDLTNSQSIDFKMAQDSMYETEFETIRKRRKSIGFDNPVT